MESFIYDIEINLETEIFTEIFFVFKSQLLASWRQLLDETLIKTEKMVDRGNHVFDTHI